MDQRRKRSPPKRIQEYNSDEDEDEEIDEDEAFNSDDERKYGSFFNKETSEGEDEDGDSGGESGSDSGDDEDDSGDDDDEDDSDDGEGGENMINLLDRLSSKSPDEANGSKEDDSRTRKLAANVKESEFSASVLKSTGLTLEDLMDGIKDTKGYGALAKTMKHVATGKAETASLPRVVQERLERKVHYDSQAKKISGWTHVVQENRQADTLDFRPQENLSLTKDMMVESFKPTTDFEKELDAALVAAGQKDEEAILKAEEKALADDLDANVITLEEYKKRRGQLAKMRALMFYHEQKRHHINKIKSKKYRRIRKRQRERLKEAEAGEDPDAAAEMKEKEEVERIKERMTLAHKNTSKWAKRVLKRGKNVDLDTRRALSAQLKKGDDLRQKMTAGDEEDDSDEDLVTTAQKVLQDVEEGDGAEDAVKGKGLFKLAFMQRGIEKERQRAKEEARALLRELEADEQEEEEFSLADGEGDAKQKSKKNLRAASKEEMKNVLKEGELVASGLAFGNSTSLTVSGIIPVGAEPGQEQKASTPFVSEHHASVDGARTEATNDEVKPVASSAKPRTKASPIVPSTERDESNPWMVDEDGQTRGSQPKKKRQRVMVDVDRAAGLLDASKVNDSADANGKQQPQAQSNSAGPTSSVSPKNAENSNTESKDLTALSQDELVRRAFAMDTDHAEQEFAKEKERVREEEEGDPARKTKGPKQDGDTVAAGWGSWTGMGAPAAFPAGKNKNKKRKFPAKLQPPPMKQMEESRPRQDKGRPDLIVRERRLKQLSNTHMLQEIPHPYTSREEYEQAMTGAIGTEWNVHSSFQKLTRPAIQTRAGKLIQPIALSAKKRGLPRPAAKF